MDLLHLLATFPSLAREFVGRRVERVLPVERRGVHLIFDRSHRGLRFDSSLAKGVCLACSSAPRRLRGGRSSWPGLPAVLDREWRGRTLEALLVHPGIPAIRAQFVSRAGTLDSGDSLTLLSIRQGGVLLADCGAEPRRSLPGELGDEAERALGTVGGFLADLGVLAAALERWVAMAGELSPEESGINLGAILPALSREGVRRLVALAAAEPAEAAGFVAALRGGEFRGGVRRALLPEFSGELESEDLVDASEAWYLGALELAQVASRRQGLARILRGEAKRRSRALAAIARESSRAVDAQVVRRQADALMAAGHRALRLEGGFWEVSDPWNPGELVRVSIDPPGATPHEAAGKLYSRARKEERGGKIREARNAQLQGELALLEQASDRLSSLPERGEGLLAGLEEVESGLESLGIAARPEHREVSAAPRSHARSVDKAARIFRSPSGFVVLVGRSSRQNDRLTFKVAAPEDFWFHVMGQPGAHVVLRTGDRREVPEEDLLFAAGLAAAWCRVSAGERVDVHVARRKHVRKPRGAPPGAVTVRKSRTLQVVVSPRPSNPGA